MISFYIHFPFCIKKCNYCDFLSFSAGDDIRDRYVDSLCGEIRRYSEYIKEPVFTVFFGGGTPSLLTPKQTERIMNAITDCYRMDKCNEISLECNPGASLYDNLKAYRDLGINRLSIGLQSTDDNELKILGRIHNYEQFVSTYSDARRAGFDNINIDIMSAIPGQTIKSYKDTLTQIVNVDPEHISAYSLIIEEGTKFHDLYAHDNSVTSSISNHSERPKRNMIPPLPNEDEEREMYYITHDILDKAGFSRYEISNYAKEGYECRHNNVYWTGGDYIGFGLNASSYYMGYRYRNPADIGRYSELYTDYENSFTAFKPDMSVYEYIDNPELHEEINKLSVKDMMEEYMFLGLRRMKGVSTEGFKKKFLTEMRNVYGLITDKLIKDGLIIEEEGYIRLSDRGIDVSNVVLSNFLLD